MPVPVRHGTASWPGAAAVVYCKYTASHGISPGTAILQMLEQPTMPNEVGNLIISDGFETVTIYDCKVNSLRVAMRNGGFVWELEILDRRWKWRDLGAISGNYNQQDDHAKLQPWTIRSPAELATFCLDAMALGTTPYTIDLPNGLNSNVATLATAMFPPWIGVTPTTGTNPATTWSAEPPASVLAKLCDKYGRHVVLCPVSNQVLVCVPGTGGTLPDGAFQTISPSITAPETPTGITVVGAPTLVQCRLILVPVGIEWDGSYRSIWALSYAPTTPATAQQVLIIVRGGVEQIQGLTFTITINGIAFNYVAAPGDDNDTVAVALANQINGSPGLAGAVNVVVFTVGPVTEIQVTASQTNVPFGYGVNVDAGPNNPLIGITADLIKAAAPGAPNWSKSPPPDFPEVVATPRLNVYQARKLAQESVWKCFQLANYSGEVSAVSDIAYLSDSRAPVVVSPLPLTIPGYGVLQRRQQILLTPFQVEQVVPEQGDDHLYDLGDVPQTLNLYNGYSRSKPAAIFGSVSVQESQSWFWNGKAKSRKINTLQADQVFTPFRIDALQQVVTFGSGQSGGKLAGVGDYIYRQGVEGIEAPVLILQTGINIRNKDTNAVERMNLSRLLPNMAGVTNFQVKTYDDCQFEIVGQYDANENIIGAASFNGDALQRANYYLDGMAAQYFQTAGLTLKYCGIRAIDLDASIMQVTWEVDDEAGCTTMASSNTEHEVFVEPYPARRRAENLRPGTIGDLLDRSSPPRGVPPFWNFMPVGS
jgi:hypothetical protein